MKVLLLLILVALRRGNRSVKVCRLGRSSVDRNSTLFMYGVPVMECSMRRTTLNFGATDRCLGRLE